MGAGRTGARAAAGPARPAPVAAPATPPPNEISVHARFAYRVGSEGKSLGPVRRFLAGRHLRTPLPRGRERSLELGVAADFFSDRFATAVVGSAPDALGNETLFAGERTLSQTSFAALQTVGWRATDLRVFAAVGPGVTIGYFSSPEGNLPPRQQDDRTAARARGARRGSSRSPRSPRVVLRV